MAGDSLEIQDEILKSALGEAASLALPGVQTAFRVAIAGLDNRGALEKALSAALAYQFATGPATPPPPRRGPFGNARARRSRRRAEKKARKATGAIAAAQGVDIPALLAASAAESETDRALAGFDRGVTPILAPLWIVRHELARATNPLIPEPAGWRHHVAEALTASAKAGLNDADEDVRRKWEFTLRHSIGITSGYVTRTPDWGRLVAAALEFELRRIEGQAAPLSTQLERADIAAQTRDLAKTADIARRSLNGLTFFLGFIALVSVVALLFGAPLLD